MLKKKVNNGYQKIKRHNPGFKSQEPGIFKVYCKAGCD